MTKAAYPQVYTTFQVILLKFLVQLPIIYFLALLTKKGPTPSPKVLIKKKKSKMGPMSERYQVQVNIKIITNGYNAKFSFASKVFQINYQHQNELVSRWKDEFGSSEFFFLEVSLK